MNLTQLYNGCVPPLKGHRETHAASVSYQALSPDGEVLPFEIKESCFAPQLIPNSEFLIPNWSYTFSAKERDSETGLSYFGSRYYSSDLSIWSSVDPMSDKYASLSPYVYCADNPVKLVDPNGEEVWLIGDEWEFAFNQLKSSTNLTLERDATTGKITYSGTIQSEGDKKLADALDDKKVHVNILAEDWDTFEGYTHQGGAHLGTDLKEDGTVVSKQFVNPLMLAGCDFFGNMEETTQPNGQMIMSPITGRKENSMLHELTEAHMAGLISLDENISLHMAVPDDSTYGFYQKAHERATPPPESSCLTPKSIRAFASLIRALRNFNSK